MKSVESLLQGNELFQKNYFKKNETELLELVRSGQHPKALFIGCADSRVIPSLITNAPPGQLFVLRNVGNFVAPHKPDEDYHAMASGIEYAVTTLDISEIIICGHTYCGAIEALYKEISGDQLIHTKKWLSLGKKAKELALLALGKDSDKDRLLRKFRRDSPCPLWPPSASQPSSSRIAWKKPNCCGFCSSSSITPAAARRCAGGMSAPLPVCEPTPASAS